VNWRRALLATLAILLAAFFTFVGWNKAFAPLADLARYGSWTVWLPESLGRLVGWSEMACAVTLLAMLVPRRERLARVAAAILVANQVVAAAMHIAHGEFDALPQNVVLVTLLLCVVCASGSWRRRGKTRGRKVPAGQGLVG